jgi:hypothetical protein
MLQRSRPSAESEPGVGDRIRRCAEVLALTLALPLIGLALGSSDPFCARGAFPWLILAVLLTGAEHGLVAALSSAGLASLGAYLHAALAASVSAPPHSWSIGCFAVALASGWASDRMRAHGREKSVRAAQVEGRLQRLSRMHRVLQLSHVRLEERLAAEGWSLDGLLRRAAQDLARVESPAAGYQLALDVLASQGQLHAAALFEVLPERAGEERRRLAPEPIARFGRGTSSAEADPVLQRALRTGHVVLFDREQRAMLDGDAVLAALPLLTSSGRWLGIVAVQQMPFIAFSEETFDGLGIVAERLADILFERLDALAPASARLERSPASRLEGQLRAEAAQPAERAFGRRERRNSDSGVRRKPDGAFKSEPVASAMAAERSGKRA